MQIEPLLFFEDVLVLFVLVDLKEYLEQLVAQINSFLALFALQNLSNP